MIKYRLRRARWADYRYCYLLTRRNMLELFTRHWGGWKASAFRTHYSPSRTHIIMLGQRRAGFLAWRVERDGPYIENLQLSPRLHGKGIGTRILEQMIKDNPDKTIGLTTFVDNPALQLYKRLGFKVIKRDAGALQMAHKIPK